MTKQKNTLKEVMRFVLPLALGGILLAFLYRKMDWLTIKRIWEDDLDYKFLLLSLLFGLFANVIRGLRWDLLVEPVVGQGEPLPRKGNAIFTVLGSYTVNMLIPRSGELWRCAEYKRYEQMSFSTLLGTLINDRLADVISLGLILVAVVLGNQDFFWNFFAGNPEQVVKLQSLLFSPWLYLTVLVFIVGSILGYRFLKAHPNNKISQIVRSIILGIASIKSMKERGRFILYSFLIWIGYFLYFYVAFWAFPFTRDLGVGTALVAFALSSMSALVPVQAGMGAWHAAVIAVLVSSGVDANSAGGFALIVHSVQTLWITLVGLIGILILPAYNRNYSRNINQNEVNG